MNTRKKAEQNAEERFAAEAGRLLREGEEQLDAATLSRLNRARQAALAELERPPAARGWGGRGWPAAAVVAVGLLAVALWIGRDPAPGDGPVPEPSAPDLELVLAEDNLELIEELEFYDWLATSGGDAGFSAGASG